MKLLGWIPILLSSTLLATSASTTNTTGTIPLKAGSDVDPNAVAVRDPVQICPQSDICYSLQDFGTEVQFTFQFPTSAGWAALGTGIWMAESTMFIAWRNPDNTFTISDRVAGGAFEPAAVPQQSSKLVPGASKVENGKNTVVFRRAKDTGNKMVAVLNSKQTDWIWAYSNTQPKGTTPGTTIDVHVNFGKFQLDVAAGTAGGATVSEGGAYGVKYLIHGVLMFLGWNFVPFLGILAAGPFKKVLGVWWFRIHVAMLGAFAPILIIAGFALVLIAKGGNHFAGPHGILGLVVIILQLPQIILGVVIDRLWNPDRAAIPWYDKAHWYIGRLLFVLAQITIILGLLVYSSSTNILVYWILYGILLGVEVLGFIGLTILMKKRQVKDK